MALPEVDADPAQVEALAKELGLGAPKGDDVELLSKLLDDDFELLEAPAQQKARERLKGTPGLSVCAGCGNLTLLRYRASRCRACGARVAGDDAAAASRRELFSDLEGPEWVRIEQPEEPLAGSFSLAKARALGRVIELGEDNEDWEVRGERLRQDAEQAEKQRHAEAEQKKKAAAEAEAKKKAEEEQKKKAAAEAAKKKAEEEARQKAEAEAKKKAEEEAAWKAGEAARQAAAEEEQRTKDKRRPSLGALFGRRAGALVRIEDAPAKVSPEKDSRIYLHETGARLYVPSGKKEKVGGKERSGFVDLTIGDVLTIGDETFVYDERSELENASAPSIHFTRKDTKPGGPWPYFNEPSTIGALRTCQLNLQDDGVEDEHARLFTRFGKVIIEDASGLKGGGLEVGGQRVPWAILDAGSTFKLGPASIKDAPELAVAAGAAELKPKGEKAASMKPSRHARTVLEVKDGKGELVRRVFLFTRREVRFGSVGRGKDGKMLNELPLLAAPGEDAEVSEKQGGLNLARDGVELRRDGTCEMLFDGESMPKGKARTLKGGFELIIGEDLTIEGRAFRSGTLTDLKGPAQLGIKGGHPVECIRLERVNCPHTYVFLVRMLRIGSEASAPMRLEMPGVQEGHAQLILNDGKLQVVSTRQSAKVHLGDVELEHNVPTNLAIDTEIRIGNAKIFFREAEDGDFTP